MAELSWTAPGKGPWELERTHNGRPVTQFMAESFPPGFVKGFQYGTARYGVLLSHLEPAYVNGYGYIQPRPFGAPPGAAGPPPKPVLWLLTRAHPKMRARIREGARSLEEKRWRADLTEWDTIDKPGIIAKHRDLQSIDVTALSDYELADHVQAAQAHLQFAHWMHHKYSVPAVLMVGDLLAGAGEWTELPHAEILALLRGASDISQGFATDELHAAAEAITASESARALLDAAGGEQSVLDDLAADPGAGGAVTAYLEAVRFRGIGYDVGDPCAGELPGLLLDTLRAATKGAPPAADLAAATEAVRAQVPGMHQADFDSRLAEARQMYRLRDERGVYSDGWATGLARRALLEAGNRLAASRRLAAAEHAVDLSTDEAVTMLRGGNGPSAEEVAGRFRFRTTHTTDDAPTWLGGEGSPPPDPAILPPAARRWARAMDAALGNLFGVPDKENTATVLIGTPVNAGVYEGPARLVDGPEDFGRIRQGDVLVTRNTSPYFNVVLPLLGALVTDRGGLLSHAAIVAREYGIPGIVGTREGTAKIADGARVRVDGTTGEVRILE